MLRLVLPLLLLLPLVACSTDPYTASMKASLDVSNAVSDGIKVVATLQTDKVINAKEEADILGYLSSITTLNQKFRQDVRAVHSQSGTKTDYLSAANIFVLSASDPQLLAAVHVVNPKAQARVQLIVNAITTALEGIQAAINNAKGA